MLLQSNYDVVLSEWGLPDGAALPLLTWLEETSSTLFFCLAVHDGCWWLPALDRGRRCWGDPALRPAEFTSALDRMVEELLGRAVEPPASTTGDVLTLPPISPEPREPQRTPVEETKEHKVSA